jgi:hypothetical protein
MKKIKASILLGFAVAFGSASAFAFTPINETFNYVDGPLAGQGSWGRGPNSPASDNPSNYIAVSDNAVRFDWTTSNQLNQLVRNVWASGDVVNTGTIYGIFDLRVLQAPQVAADSRPGFFSFGNSDGNQQRGFLGLQAGTTADTFQLGVAPDSQLSSNYSFSNSDLAINTSYVVTLGFNVETQDTSLWIGTDDVSQPASLTVAGSGINSGIRRANLRLYNSDGSTGVTNLGIFEIDSLMVTTTPIPEPSTYALLFGLLGLGVIGFRRLRRS